MIRPRIRSPRRAVVASALMVAGLAVIARLAFTTVYGVHLGADSYYYLATAERFVGIGARAVLGTDLVSAPLYPISIALTSVILRIDLVTAAMTLHVAAGALTAILLMRITHRIGGSIAASVIAGGIAAITPSLLFWGTYVLSETLFLLAVAFAVDRAIVVIRSRRVVLDAFVASIALLIALMARSTAIAFVLAVAVALFLGSRSDPRRMLQAVAGAGIAAVLGLATFAATTGGLPGLVHFDRLARYAWSAVYMGLEWTDVGRATNGVDLTGGPAHGDHQRAVLEWLAADPGHFVLQAFRKLKVFWTPVLPEFSYRHAALNLAWYVPLYVAALNGIRLRRHVPELLILVAGLVAFTLQAMITFVDYDQRFRLPAELLLIPLAAIGLTPLCGVAYGAMTSWGRRRPSADRTSITP